MIEKKIKFSSPYFDVLEKPRPSKFYMPEAYKKIPKTVTHDKKTHTTVKGCVPFLDALMLGYTIPFATDIYCYYDLEKSCMNFEVSDQLKYDSNLFGVNNHTSQQVSEDLRYNKRTVDAVFKFHSAWKIQTPPGYSCLFTQPLNHNCPFKIVEGVVDTDVFPLIIHYPFYWTHDVEKPLTLKAGEPMVQVIPFKRESWQCEITKEEKPEDFHKHHIKWGTKFRDIYKQLVWKKKSFK